MDEVQWQLSFAWMQFTVEFLCQENYILFILSFTAAGDTESASLPCNLK